MGVDCKMQRTRWPEAAASADGDCFRHRAGEALIAYMGCGQLSLQPVPVEMHFGMWLAGVEALCFLAETCEQFDHWIVSSFSRPRLRSEVFGCEPSTGKLISALQAAGEHGWTVVDMKVDWNTIFGD